MRDKWPAADREVIRTQARENVDVWPKEWTGKHATQEVSLDAQRAKVAAHGGLHGHELARTYADEGIIGKRADNRRQSHACRLAHLHRPTRLPAKWTSNLHPFLRSIHLSKNNVTILSVRRLTLNSWSTRKGGYRVAGMREGMMHREMRIPKLGTWGMTVWLAGIWLIVLTGSGCAIWNLVDGAEYIASSIWLVIMVLMVGSSVREEGIRWWWVNRLGEVAGRNVAWGQPAGGKCEEVCFGYDVAGMRILQRRVILTEIETVEWSTGQATSLAGRDMNDWMVVLWYGHLSAAERVDERWRRPARELWIVGPSRAKEVTAAFGSEFLEFLRGLGVLLVREEEHVYVRSAAVPQKMEPGDRGVTAT